MDDGTKGHGVTDTGSGFTCATTTRTLTLRVHVTHVDIGCGHPGCGAHVGFDVAGYVDDDPFADSMRRDNPATEGDDRNPLRDDVLMGLRVADGNHSADGRAIPGNLCDVCDWEVPDSVASMLDLCTPGWRVGHDGDERLMLRCVEHAGDIVDD